MTLGFTLPLYVFLAGQTGLAITLMLPLPLCKPGVVFIRYMSTPVGKSISATAMLFLVGAKLARTLLGAGLSAFYVYSISCGCFLKAETVLAARCR